ncbi:tetratricopeptide repeat protein [Arcobacter arenosus]|uniref:beta-lactamase n=1 Tax=Arcobacter arenosus TaxID=2576037 RepID=A0A5R8Y3F2_9BACT|nr:tetratricopeptide repeat protein [Arcobacter arenosus]TLP40629.1 sel1 repeat family protein [Arcobacter arenosus]
MKKTIVALVVFINILNAISFEEVKNHEKKYGTLEALSHYRNLASKNNTKAMIEIAKIYANGKEVQRSFQTSYEYLQKASKLNDPEAFYLLGKLQLNKKTPYYNLVDAYNSFIKSSKLNYAPAQNILGVFLVNGVVIEKDFKMAVKYFERASKQGLIEAQCNLAFMYASGKGVFPNFGRAHAFAKKGKEIGNKKCIKVWKDYNLKKYPEDKGWKFNFYNKP